MTGINTNYVGSLLSNVLGIALPIYLPIGRRLDYQTGLKPYDLKQKEDTVEYDDAPTRMGKKVFGSFRIKSDEYKEWNHRGELVDVEFADYLMPVATIVTFSRDKAVIKTTTLGAVGTVKEVYGLADWTISIDGIILPDDANPIGQQTVEEQKEKIQQFHELAGSLRVEGQVFAERNITRIVTESLSFTPVAGKPGVMQYSITAVSDGDMLLTDVM